MPSGRPRREIQFYRSYKREVDREGKFAVAFGVPSILISKLVNVESVIPKRSIRLSRWMHCFEVSWAIRRVEEP